MTEQTPEDFDWVSAHASCNAAATFDRLRAGAAEDVGRRNAQIGDDGHPRFAVEDGEDEDQFEVTRIDDDDQVTAFVSFKREGRRILVAGDGVDVDLTIVTTVDASGACRCVVGEALYTEWEVRRMALEVLFFEMDAPEE